MVTTDIPMAKAELLSVILEAILYGFSLLMFGGTILVLLDQRFNFRVNYKMLAAAWTLLTLSTMHLVIHIIRIMEGLVLYGYSYPRGPNAFFSDVAQWSFFGKNCVYIAQSLVGDAVVLYRCYIVWQSKLVLIFPALLWCATGVTGFGAIYIESKAPQSGVFAGVLGKWAASFWALALSTNLLATILLAWRIWSVDREVKNVRVQKSQLRPLLRIIIDTGLVYSLTLITALACFLNGINAHYVVLDMVTPIISIAFYVVIIRVRLAGRARWMADSFFSSEYQSAPLNVNLGRQNRMEIHVATSTESKVDNSIHLQMSPKVPIIRETRWSGVEPGDV